jgi:HEAT repeat protein
VRPLLDRLSRELVMHAVARGDAPPDVTAALTTYLLDTWREDRLLDDAASHRSRRDKWRRMAALRIVAQLDADRALDLLARAVAEPDPDVASTALSLLGRSTDPRAVDILIGALRAQRHPASKVAAHLERSPQPIAAAMTPLLRDSDAVVRAWAATLLGQSTDAVEPGTTDIERELAAVASDADPRVRKAAVQALGRVGGDLGARTARHLMTDPVPYVRAHAARALADLDRVELAPEIAVLLGDTDWWVRHAAKQALETLGSEVWPVLVRALDDEDKFVRNGAAEVIQNLGILDTLIVMEAATDLPSPKKIDLLRRIASAGGARLTDSLLERTGPALGPRMRHLLTTLGLEHVEAA